MAFTCFIFSTHDKEFVPQNRDCTQGVVQCPSIHSVRVLSHAVTHVLAHQRLSGLPEYALQAVHLMPLPV